MRKLFLLLAVATALFARQRLAAAEFHVAPDGNDANTGTSSRTAWQSLERVNRHAFQPGDAVLLKSGGVWKGQIRPQGSGTEGKPIRLDRYGDGPLPVIDAGTNIGAVVSLLDQDWWEIHHLDMRGSGTNAPPGDRQGIHIQGRKASRTVTDLILRIRVQFARQRAASPPLAVPAMELVFAEKDGNKHPQMVPTVLHAKWQLVNGRTATIFACIAEKPVEFAVGRERVRLEPGEAAFRPSK